MPILSSITFTQFRANHTSSTERVRAIEEKQKLDATRWANAPATPTEEISWRSRTRDDKDDADDSKDHKDEDDEEEEESVENLAGGGGGRERAADGVWRPGGG